MKEASVGFGCRTGSLEANWEVPTSTERWMILVTNTFIVTMTTQN